MRKQVQEVTIYIRGMEELDQYSVGRASPPLTLVWKITLPPGSSLGWEVGEVNHRQEICRLWTMRKTLPPLLWV